MKRYTEYMLFFVLLISSSAFGQENENKFETKIGYGYYQGFNLGLNYFYTEKLSTWQKFTTLVKATYIAAKKQVGYIIQSILEQALGSSAVLFNLNGPERVKIYSSLISPDISDQHQWH